jgi:4-hydroxybenzoate polyprenyltransferase
MPVDAKKAAASPSRLTTWGRLLRLPNLFTVPGDPIAGYLLASGGVLGWNVLGAVAAALCLYCAGLLLNDYFDRRVDARERPDRPIPSGAIRARKVLVVGCMLLPLGVLLAFGTGGWVTGLVAFGVALAVFVYDAGLKRIPQLGCLVMGLCRAGSVLLGAAAADGLASRPPQGVALITGIYIWVVTVLATREAQEEVEASAVFMPGVLLALMGLMMWISFPPARSVAPFALLALAVCIAATWWAAWPVFRQRGRIPVFIGKLIRALIPLQAAWCLWALPGRATSAAWAIVLAGAVLWTGARLAARRFYGS